MFLLGLWKHNWGDGGGRGGLGGGQGARPEEVISMKAEGGCYEGNCRDEGRGGGAISMGWGSGASSLFAERVLKRQHGQGQQKTNMARNMRGGGGGLVVVGEVVQTWRRRQGNCSNWFSLSTVENKFIMTTQPLLRLPNLKARIFLQWRTCNFPSTLRFLFSCHNWSVSSFFTQNIFEKKSIVTWY